MYPRSRSSGNEPSQAPYSSQVAEGVERASGDWARDTNKTTLDTVKYDTSHFNTAFKIFLLLHKSEHILRFPFLGVLKGKFAISVSIKGINTVSRGSLKKKKKQDYLCYLMLRRDNFQHPTINTHKKYASGRTKR